MGATGSRDQRWGRIINMCSLAMKTGGLDGGHRLHHIEGWARRVHVLAGPRTRPDGITANGIAPAYVKTKMITEQLTEEQRQETLRGIPVRRFCETEEVAHAVVFLSSPLAGFITGEILDINGGLHLD